MSNLFGNQNNGAEETYLSDSDDKDLKFGNRLSASVNQNVRRKEQNPIQFNRNNTNISSSNDDCEHQEQNWGKQIQNYKELKDEITEKVTNNTNKLIDNLKIKFKQTNENIERRQDKSIGVMFDRLKRTLDDINRQNNSRTETRNIENNNIQNNRQQESRTRRTNSITT